MRQKIAGREDFIRVGQHRNQKPDRTERRSPQNRPELNLEQFGLRETKADRAPPQRRIFSKMRAA